MALRPVSSSFNALRGVARLCGRRTWKLAALWLRGVRVLAVDVAGVLGILVLVLFVWREATREVVQIDPISVPPDLAGNGYTGEVLAQRIMDHILRIQVDAKTTMRKREIGIAGRQSDIVVPGVGFSVGTAASFVGDLIGTPRTRVRGEVTRQGNLYHLTLRIEGVGPIASTPAVALQDIDSALKAGAEGIARIAEPYVLASYYYDVDKSMALAQVDEILKVAAPGSEALMRAYNLRGLIFKDQGRHDDAIESYRAAIAQDLAFSVAHVNLADALAAAGQASEAMAAYRKAIALEPTAAAHNNLAMILVDEGRLEEGIASYRRAIALDPANAVVHSNLGDALRRNGHAAEALDELQTAIRLDPGYVFAHHNLGLAYHAGQQYDQAVTSFRQAIALNAMLAPTHYELGNTLRQIANSREAAGDSESAALAWKDACDAFKQSVKLAPDNPTHRAALDSLNGWEEWKRCELP